MKYFNSGQIMATSHEFSPQMDPNGGLVREIPLLL